MKLPSLPNFPRTRLALAFAAAAVGTATLIWFGVARGSVSAVPTAVAAPAATAGTTALTVDLTTPTRQTLERTVTASGSVGARDELVVGSDAGGVRLVEVFVDVGASVQRGQLLARGDDAQLLAQLAQQDAQIKQARAERIQADANLERAVRVEDSGLYSVEAVQTRRTAALQAAARLELAEAQRRELQVKIAHTRVVAPAAGVVVKRSATVGAVMQSGQELFRVIRDGELEWLAELPDHALARVRAGATVGIGGEDGTSVAGTVRLVAPTIDPRSRNGLVYVTLPKDAPLKAGGHARGEIVVASAATETLPESVVLTRDGQPFVYVVDADAVAHLRRIETGERQRGVVEVTGGLAAGSRVVATGAGFVKDGERVRIAPAAVQQAATAAGAQS